MIIDILLFALGTFVGAALTILLIALLSANKRDDLAHEKWMSFKDGYEKGYDDGYELRKSRLE